MYRDMNKVGRPCIDECSCGCYDNKAGYLGTSPLDLILSKQPNIQKSY